MYTLEQCFRFVSLWTAFVLTFLFVLLMSLVVDLRFVGICLLSVQGEIV